MKPVFSEEFFKELQERMFNFWKTLEKSAVIGVLIFVAVLVLVVLQQIILIVLFPFRDL